LTTSETSGERRFYGLATIAFRKTIPACFVIGRDRFSAKGATHFETRCIFLNQFFSNVILCHTTTRRTTLKKSLAAYNSRIMVQMRLILV